MNKRKGKRVTIYDIAQQIGISPSAVSKALNDQSSVSAKTKALVKSKARELNYKHNSNAANLRRGSSRTIGVIVPKINTAFFSNAIAGMEEACFENGHKLIICQSDESYLKEMQAVETLIQYNVDCIIISLSMETKSTKHLQDAIKHNMNMIQFDRVDHSVACHTIENDNKDAAYKAVRHLISNGYRKIVLLGGAAHLTAYRDRKEGYLKAIEEADLDIPYNYLVEEALTIDHGREAALRLLKGKNVPDAFFAMSDYAALGAMKAALSLGLEVPDQVGIMGFANEIFSELISPGISSVDQQSRKMGKNAAKLYFDHILDQKSGAKPLRRIIIDSSVIIRDSSRRKQHV